MTTRRKSILLQPHERQCLIDLYMEREIPLDQYEERKDELAELCNAFCQETGRSDKSGDIFHYMRNQRKSSKWVTLDGKHKQKKPPVDLTADEKEVLLKIVTENLTSLGMGTDELGYDEAIASLIAKEFLARTGRGVPSGELIAVVTAIRKRGLMEKVEDVYKKPEDAGFDDIDEVA